MQGCLKTRWRIVLAAILVLSLGRVHHVAAQNVLALTGATAAPGASVQLDVGLTVDQNLSLLRFDVSFDAALCNAIVDRSGNGSITGVVVGADESIVPNHDIIVRKTNRVAQPLQEATFACAGGILTVAVFDLAGSTVIAAGNGDIATIEFEVRGDATSGAFTWSPTNIQGRRGPSTVTIASQAGTFTITGGPLCTPADCNDNNLCTNDACVAGSCQHTAVVCNDGVSCTVDSCNGATGCIFTPDNTRCDDSDACTQDLCHSATGCTHQPVPPACGNGCVEAGEECDDGNTSSGDGCAADCQLEPSSVLDHFLGYKVKESRGNICAAGAPNEGASCENEQDCGGDDTTSFCVKNHFTSRQILLKDQFEENLFAVQKLVSLYNPANKNDEGIINASIHFIGYQLTEAKVCSDTKTPCTTRRECNIGAVCKPHKHEPRDNIRVDNQFGALVVDTIAPNRLLVPTTKSHDGPVAAPDPSNHEVDHFKCYTVKPSKDEPGLPKGIHVSVVDQFNQPTLYDVQKPSRLCTPVDKNGEGIKHPRNHLMCYVVKPVGKTCTAEAPENARQSCKKEEECGGTTRETSFCQPQEKHEQVLGIYTNNQLGPALVDTSTQEELCVPSVKTEP